MCATKRHIVSFGWFLVLQTMEEPHNGYKSTHWYSATGAADSA